MSEHPYLDSLGSGDPGFEEGIFDKPNPDLLETFPNPAQFPTVITIRTDEFTSLCPKTGQPDWARIIVRYAPAAKCVESKSFKLYLAGYRNHGEFHEACVQRILQDLSSLLRPQWMVVEGHFTPRGGISFRPVSTYGEVNLVQLEMSYRIATGERGIV